MKHLLFIIIAFLFTAARGIAQPASYDLAAVPENIKKNAAVIKRYENIFFDIKDIDHAYLSVDKIVTITSEAGKSDLVFAAYTNKHTDLQEAEIKVFDARGKQIARYKKNDMHNTAYGEGLVEDGRLTYFSVAAASYPVTVEFKYEKKYKGSLQYPEYNIMGFGEGVENSSFTARVPASLDLRYKEKNIRLAPEISKDEKYKTYKWTVKNLSPLEYEEDAVSWESRYPSIILAPNRFKLYDYDGDMSTWKQFGNWEKGLMQGLYALPEDRKAFFAALVKDAANEREKIRRVYDYLQKNFRYVSIQLGIGGYRPFPAAFTDQKKYGDCKGLSFYMHAVLALLDIKSFVALINAGYDQEPVEQDFPCNQFNHMILCVPQKKDTIWLECTSNTNDFAVLGSFTENRNALLITEEGGLLVPTPRSKSSDNVFHSAATVTLADDASGHASAQWQTSGQYAQEIMHYILQEKKDDQKDFIINHYGYKQPDEFSLRQHPAATGLATSMDMRMEKIPEFIAGSKMFLSPRLYSIFNKKLPAAGSRRLDYYFEHPFEKTDTTVYILPQGYVPDALPEQKALQCSYGSWSSRCWYSNDKGAVYSASRLVLLQHRIPATDYASVKSFFDEVLRDDNQRIVIKKQ